MYKDKFIEYITYEKRFSANTILSYKNDLEEFQNFIQSTEGNLTIEQGKKIHIRNYLMYLSEKKLQTTSINRKISTLKRFYKYLLKQGVVDFAPTQNISNLRVKKEVQIPLSTKEMDALPILYEVDQGFFSYQKQMIIELLYQTGIRKSELINLQVKDVNQENNQIKVVGKRNKERLIPISDKLKVELRYLLEIKNQESINSEYLFCNQNGKKMYPKFVYNIVTSYLSQISTKQKISPHMLRHTFATHILNKGAEINSVKELLGHSSLAATQVYTHQNIENLKQVFNQSHPREKNKKR